MGNLKDQMEALAQGIATSARQREMAVGDSKAQTASMLLAFGQKRAAMRRGLRRRLAQSTEATANDVVALRTDFARSRADSNKAYRHMIKAQHAWLSEDRRDRSGNVAELMNGFHISHGKMARDLAESLAKSTRKVKSEVSGLNGFGAWLGKARRGACAPRQIPNFLLTAQAGRVAPVPVLAPSREPEKRTKSPVAKTTVAKKVVRAPLWKLGKPKKK